MFTAHKNFGIGQVISNDGKMIEIYYPDVDKTTKTIAILYLTMYDTEKEAEEELEAMKERANVAQEAREIETKNIL